MKDIQSHLRHSKADTTANEYMQELPESVGRMVESMYEEFMHGQAAASADLLPNATKPDGSPTAICKSSPLGLTAHSKVQAGGSFPRWCECCVARVDGCCYLGAWASIPRRRSYRSFSRSIVDRSASVPGQFRVACLGRCHHRSDNERCSPTINSSVVLSNLGILGQLLVSRGRRGNP